MDREERLRQQELRSRENAERIANTSKLNSKSDALLRQRAERETRALFEYLDRRMTGEVTYEDIAAGAEVLVSHGLLSVNAAAGQSSHTIAERVWQVLLDKRKQASISLASGQSTAAGHSETQEAVSVIKIDLDIFSQKVVPVAARAYLGVQLDSAELYDSTVDKGKLMLSTTTSAVPPTPPANANNAPPSTPPRSPYHIPRTGDAPSTKSPHKFKPVILKKDLPKSLISAKTAAINVKKASLGSAPTPPSNIYIAQQQIRSLDESADVSFLTEQGDKPVRLDDIAVHGRLPTPPAKRFAPVVSNPNAAVVSIKLIISYLIVHYLPFLCIFITFTNLDPHALSRMQVPSSYAVFRTFFVALLELLRTRGTEFSARTDVSRIRAKSRAEAVQAVEARNSGGTFAPQIPDRSRELALSKEERDAAFLLQQTSEDNAIAISSSVPLLSPSSPKKSNLDKMLERAKADQERKQRHKEALLEEQMRECTFQPNINRHHIPQSIAPSDQATPAKVSTNIEKASAQDDPVVTLDQEGTSEASAALNTSSTSTLGQIYEYNSEIPAFERLYAMKDKSPRSSRIVHKSKEEQELELCTFAPKLAPYAGPAVAEMRDVHPTGWDQAVSRLRKNAAARVMPRERSPDTSDELNRRYAQARQGLIQGTKEFSFFSEQRISQRQAKRSSNAQPQLYVEIKLTATKTANVPVYDGDDPAELSRRFCKIYAFPVDAVAVLEEVFRQSMESNGLQIAKLVKESTTNDEADVEQEADRTLQDGTDRDQKQATEHADSTNHDDGEAVHSKKNTSKQAGMPEEGRASLDLGSGDARVGEDGGQSAPAALPASSGQSVASITRAKIRLRAPKDRASNRVNPELPPTEPALDP